jgi:hypothetical protein
MQACGPEGQRADNLRPALHSSIFGARVEILSMTTNLAAVADLCRHARSRIAHVETAMRQCAYTLNLEISR